MVEGGGKMHTEEFCPFFSVSSEKPGKAGLDLSLFFHVLTDLRTGEQQL